MTDFWKKINYSSHFQNSVSFENGSKNQLLGWFSTKSRVAFSKTEVFKKPHSLFSRHKPQKYLQAEKDG